MPQSNPANTSTLRDRTTFTNPKSELTRVQQRIIADVLAWGIPQEINPDEIEAIAVTNDILWVKLTDHRTISIALDTFRTIRCQQLEEQARRAAEVDVAHVLGRTSTNVLDSNAKPKMASVTATVVVTPQSTYQELEKVLTVYTTASVWTGVSSRGVVVFRLPPNESASVIEEWIEGGWSIVYISTDNKFADDNTATTLTFNSNHPESTSDTDREYRRY